MISIRDTAVRKELKENYYHGLLLGLLSYKDSWYITSNRESGDGYCDILGEIDTDETGFVIEIKYADDGDLDAACQEALEQIDENQTCSGIQLSRRCVVTKARSRAPALRPRPLRPYVSAALCSERKCGRRDNTPP